MRSYKVDVEVFERMPVARAVLAQSIPAIVAQLIALLYNWADTFFLARLNKPELVAAATIVLPLYLMLTAIGNLPGVGGGSQFANHLGKHDYTGAQRVASVTFWMGMILALVCCLSFPLYSDILLSLIGANERTLAPAKEYAFLRTKFGLSPMDGSIWKHARLRPQNSPELRIRQFAQLLYQSESLLSKILDTDDLKELEVLFAVPQMGKSSVDILLINTVIPYKYAYALHQNNPVKAEQALRLMEKIPAENNTIVRQWRVLGQEVKNAADTQALLHLYQNYCQHHECINCEVGYKIFENRQLTLF